MRNDDWITQLHIKENIMKKERVEQVKSEILDEIQVNFGVSLSPDNLNFLERSLTEIYTEFTNQSTKNIDKMIMETFEVPITLGWLNPKTFDNEGNPIDYDVDTVENIDNLTTQQCLTMADVVSNEMKQVDRVMSDDEFTKKFYL